MMPRRVAVMLVVDLLLLAAIGLSQLGDRAPASIEFRLPALGALDGLTIERTGQPTVELRRQDDRWTVADGPIDPYALEALSEAFATPLGADLALAVEGARLDDYGLGEHAITLRLRGDGAPSDPVRIGRVVDGRRTFVWPEGGDRIFRLRADLGQVFERPAVQWSDRRLVTVGVEDLAALRMRRGERMDWSARRAAPDQPWALDHPPGLVAGQDEVGAVAATLVTARAVGFVAPEGFAPTGALEAQTFDGRRVSIEFRPADGGLLARLPSRARLAQIPRHQAVFLDAHAADLRERRVFGGVAIEAVQGVVIEGPDALRLARQPDGRWQMLAPQKAGPLPAAPVDAWLGAVVGLRAVGFADRVVDDAFARPERLHLEVGGRQLTLEIGGPFGQGARLARRADAPTRVMVLGASVVERLRPDPAALLDDGPAAQPR